MASDTFYRQVEQMHGCSLKLSGQEEKDEEGKDQDGYGEHGDNEERGHGMEEYRRRKKRHSHGGPACPAKIGAPLRYYYGLCKQGMKDILKHEWFIVYCPVYYD